jgi:TatD DNase family protein
VLADSHAHLDDDRLQPLVVNLQNWKDRPIIIVSNSVDYVSSLRNIQLATKLESFYPFIGIHPEVFARAEAKFDKTSVDSSVEKLKSLLPLASGIGEIGLDPKYGSPREQEYLLEKMLSLAESLSLPVTLHNRDTVSQIIEILKSYSIKGKIMFHWFAGSDSELHAIQDRGMYISFGPSILFSKRLARLFGSSDPEFILSETDAPTPFSFLKVGCGNPYLIASVVFEMSLITKVSFEEMRETLEKNTRSYLGTQN